jgi:branched-chain amino acid aminotransferase
VGLVHSWGVRFWVDDGLVAADEARVSVLDHGFTVADGVFETLKVTSAGPFALTRHLRRLARSAAALGLPVPDVEHVRTAVERTVAANADEVGDLARLRITYTAGIAPLGSERGPGRPTLVVSMSEMSPWAPTADVATVSWPRNERSALAGVKSTSYAENVIALADAKRRGASEALMPDTRGMLSEGTGSNVFVVLDGRVMTPSLAAGCLPGITRELVLEWCDVDEADIPMARLAQVHEAFITSSTRDIQPVRRIDDRVLAAPGALTAECLREFSAREAADVDP